MIQKLNTAQAIKLAPSKTAHIIIDRTLTITITITITIIIIIIIIIIITILIML